MNKTRKTAAIGESNTASFSPHSIWRRLVNRFRRDHDPLLIASLSAFNERPIYISPEFSWPLRLILSRL